MNTRCATLGQSPAPAGLAPVEHGLASYGKPNAPPAPAGLAPVEQRLASYNRTHSPRTPIARSAKGAHVR